MCDLEFKYIIKVANILYFYWTSSILNGFWHRIESQFVPLQSFIFLLYICEDFHLSIQFPNRNKSRLLGHSHLAILSFKLRMKGVYKSLKIAYITCMIGLLVCLYSTHISYSNSFYQKIRPLEYNLQMQKNVLGFSRTKESSLWHRHSVDFYHIRLY